MCVLACNQVWWGGVLYCVGLRLKICTMHTLQSQLFLTLSSPPQIASIHSSSYLDGGGDRTLTHRSDTIYDSSGKAYVPALGPLWHHCVTTRYVLQEGDPRTVAPPRADTDTARVRSIRLIKSPLVDAWVCRYTICKSGVTSVVPDYDRPVTS